ncbi:MAG: nitroreductase family protein [Fusobacteriaceae bacterium]
MKRVIVPIKLKPDTKEEFLKELNYLIMESRKENGCIEYNFVETDNANFCYIIELWKNKDAYRSHLRTPHFLYHSPRLAKFREIELPVETYDIGEIEHNKSLLENSIFKRRSVREYENKEVEEEKIENILRAAMSAPTAGNQQSWEFVVIKNKNHLNKLSTISQFSTPIGLAPLAIVVMATTSGKKYPQNIEQDLAAATENILLQSVEEGLGGVWIGLSPELDRMESVRKILDLSHEKIPFSIIPIGYPLNEGEKIDRFNRNKVSILN